MQKEFYFDDNPQCSIWDWMWTNRTIEQELEACDLESPPRELFLSYLARDDKIVDAGCGFGKWVIYLKRQGYDIMGIDDNELAVAKLRDFDDSLHVELGNILDVHYPDNSFNAYISMGVVEHFEDGPTSALREAYRLLKPNGLIFVSVPTVNIVRRLIRRPFRNTINALPTSLFILRLCWGTSKREAICAAIGNILPWKKGKYYHFLEYRYSKSELENFLGQCNFEIVTTEPHDYYDSTDHSVGLVVDFPFLRARNGVNFQVNSAGRLISRLLNKVSPWIACSSVLCVGKSLKEET